jgi:hypothetical protein
VSSFLQFSFQKLKLQMFAFLLLLTFEVTSASKVWIDCSYFRASTRTSSLYITSDIMAWGRWTSDTNVPDFSTAVNWCSGAITPGTRLAVIKDAEVAKEIVDFAENWCECGNVQNYIGLQQLENATNASSDWSWIDGSNADVNSTYWASSEPALGNHCGSLNAYATADLEGYLSAVSCNTSEQYFICEIPGKLSSFSFMMLIFISQIPRTCIA